MSTQDTIDVARAVAMTKYFTALKSGDETKRLEALADVTRLHQQKTARQMRELERYERKPEGLP